MVTTVTKPVNFYVTSDGCEFCDLDAAEAWEESLKEKQYFAVNFRPDLSEGRGLQEQGKICVIGFGDLSYEMAVFACERAFGGTYAFVQGHFTLNAMMKNFAVIKDNEQTAESLKKLRTVIIVQSKDAKYGQFETAGIYRVHEDSLSESGRIFKVKGF